MQRWEKFTAGPNIPHNTRKYVSINPRGTILLNRVAYEALNAPEAVVMYFEDTNCLIGLKSARLGLTEAFPVNNKDGYWFINAAPFCKNYRIRIDKTERFVEPEMTREGMMSLDLKKTVSTAKTNRVHSNGALKERE